MLVHGLGWKIHNAFFQILYKIFIKFPLYFVAGVGDGITYLSGSKISDLIFQSRQHHFAINPLFLNFLLIAGTLMIIFAALFLLRVSLQHSVQSELGGLVARIISGLFLILLIPIVFFCANFLIVNLIRILLKQKLSGYQLANQVGQLGWANDQSHPDWDFTHVPNFDDGYSLFLGTFGTFFCLVIFFILGLTLVKRIFDLFLLYVISPVVIATAASGARWNKVNLWKDLVIARFISSVGVILAISLFLSLSPQLFAAGKAAGGAWYQKTALALLFICGGAVATLQSQQLFATLVGHTVGIQDGLSMLATTKAGIGNIKAKTLSVIGFGRGLRRGGREYLTDTNGNKTKIQYQPGWHGMGQRIHHGAKNSASAILKTAGFLAGAVKSTKNLGIKKTVGLGTQAIVNKTKWYAKQKIKKSIQTHFQKGMGKHHTVNNHKKNHKQKHNNKKP